jgi:plasmid maintenance system antidote protein VapI
MENQALIKFISDVGHNQASFGREVGVQRATVNGWVQQGKQPSPAVLIKMAQTFKKNPIELNVQLGFDVDLSKSIPHSTLLTRVHRLEKEVGALRDMLASATTATA